MSDTREHILQTAFSLFLQRSFKAVTMSDLEKATGLTKGAFYHYFKSKEEIFIEVINKYYLPSRLFETEEMAKIDHLDAFIECRLKLFLKGMENLKKYAKVELPDPFYFTLLHEVREYYPNFYEKAKKLIQIEGNQWERVIVKAKENGEIRPDLEAYILAETFMSLEMGLMRIIKQKKSIDYAFNILEM